MRLAVWKSVLVVGAVLTTAYFFLPNESVQNAAYAVLGDDVTSLYSVVNVTLPFPSYADALYLLGYPFLFAGVLRLTRESDRTFWLEETADAAIVAIGFLAASWQFLMDSYVHDVTLSSFGMLVNLAYPMMDVALVFIVLRAIVFRRSKEPYLLILGAAMLLMGVADFTYDVLTLHNSYATGNFVDGLFLFQYVLLAAAPPPPSVHAAPPPPLTEGDRVERGSTRN